MPWLADLVQSSEGSLDVLPVQCLCEFLLHDAADESASGEEEEEGESKEQRAKKRQVNGLLGWLLQVFEWPGSDMISLDGYLLFPETAEAEAAAWAPAGLAPGPQS